MTTNNSFVSPLAETNTLQEIRITSWEDPPFSSIQEHNGVLVGQGYAFQILDMLKNRFSFTYKIVPPVEQFLGDDKTGIVSMLAKNVDMIVAFLPIMPKLDEIINYSTAIDEMEMTFLMRRPAGSATGSGLLAPFSPEVWYSILTALLIVGPTIWLSIQIRHLYSKDEQMWRYTLPRCMWFVYGGLLKQGTTATPRADCTRLLFASWWIFVTILSSFYTANLTAFLTLSHYTLGIDSIDDMVYRNFRWFAMKGRAVDSAIENEFGDFESMKKSVQWKYGEFITDYFITGEELLKRIQTTNKVFVTEMQFARWLIYEDFRNKTRMGVLESQRCSHIAVPKPVYFMQRAFAFRKNSSILSIFDQELIYMVENGLIKHIKKESIPSVNYCPPNLPTKEKRLRISDLQLMFKIVASGYCVATGILILEGILAGFIKICCSRKNRRNKISSSPLYSSTDNQKLYNRSPPPFYQTIQNFRDAKKYSINGREYYVIKGNSGDTRLIPIRVPSAYLFQQFAA